ncbi:c-type cytochrome [Aureimonas altamirensis]|uniref:cytochrome c oxidase subunit II n=1 Tax=Aureimonas altamirensis TaxID=370622 RepID=UPI0020369751|nr:c-type cytochrome [Aureimonas altamirensis]MCM2504881.1 c-type cytochrome [Aureimonas altamirensis]
MRKRGLHTLGVCTLTGAMLAGLSGCTSPQSTFLSAGTESEAVNALFFWMLGGAVLIWLFVMGISIYATRTHPGAHRERAGIRLIVWGGVAFPVVTLTLLLAFGLWLMPELRREGDGMRIAVSGERFWWRIFYDTPAEPGVQRALPRAGVESANELWLPVGVRTELLLGSPDVIHSFWVPALGGKVDMIPGRVNRLVLEPTREGVFNGVCAEFCGTAHAQMAFRVRVVSQDAFAAYVEAQGRPADAAGGAGQDAFMANGCGACHAVRGTQAEGGVGPDLTHVGGRSMLGAGTLEMSADNLAAFIAAPDHVKQGVEMPAFGMIPRGEVVAIAQWLEGLE